VAANGQTARPLDETGVSMEQRWNDNNGENRRTGRETFPSVTTHPTWARNRAFEVRSRD
jgi:hypothetical protein